MQLLVSWNTVSRAPEAKHCVSTKKSAEDLIQRDRRKREVRVPTQNRNTNAQAVTFTYDDECTTTKLIYSAYAHSYTQSHSMLHDPSHCLLLLS